MPGTHSAGTVQRRLKGHKKEPEQVIHRQVAQKPHSGSYTSADMRRPSSLNATCPTHVHTGAQLMYMFTDIRRHSSLEYTHPSSPMPSCMLTHNFPHTPSHNTQLQCIQTHIHTHHHPLHPILIPWHPHEPAPALLSTRDWPTRIRILDARMDRQKLSKMMERSDLINLRRHSGQRQRSWLPCPTWGDSSPPVPPSRCPTYLQKAA